MTESSKMRLLLVFITLLSFANAQRASITLGSKLNQKKKTSFFATATELNVEDESASDEDIIVDEEDEQHFFKSCEVGFEGIKLILEQKGKKPERIILDGSLKGIAKPGRMLAVMGPSGSGKSSLVHAIAGRIGESKKITVEGKGS